MTAKPHEIISINHILQTESLDCAPAVVAMVADISIEKAKRVLFWDGKSTPLSHIQTSLGMLGYATQRLEKCWLNPWPPRPWAPCHIVFINQGDGHWVVMDVDGRWLCPLDLPRPDKRFIKSVCGIWKVSDSIIDEDF